MVKKEYPKEYGFKNRLSGVHTSRTMMFEELENLLEVVPPEAAPVDYEEAIIEDNVLYKKTHTTRKTTAQKLKSLYALDPEVPIYNYFRTLWEKMEEGKEMLACLLANARDPVLRLTLPPILDLEIGREFSKKSLLEALKEKTGDEFTVKTLESTSRNAASTWTQSGHLKGHSTKYRSQPDITPGEVVYGLLLGHLCGRSGERLSDTYWMKVLDVEDHVAEELAKQASHQGLLSYQKAGNVVNIDFSPIIEKEQRLNIQ